MYSLKYSRSSEFPSEIWDNADFPTIFRPRISNYASLTDDACWAVRDDLIEAGVNESIVQGYGCVDSVSGNAIALWFPEGLPNRLPIAAYMVEYAFAHDDIADSSENFDESNNWLDSQDATDRKDKKSQTTLALKSIRARFVVEALENDEELGEWLIEEWKKQLSVKAEERDKDYKSIEEYLNFRRVDAGADCALVMQRFVSDTTITRAEIESVRHLSDLLYNAQILVNDDASWQKEIEAYEIGKAGSLVNAVSVVMKLESVDAQAAKKILWNKAIAYERQYCRERDDFIEKNIPEPRVLEWFRLLELCNGGSAVWSQSTPRYNRSAPKPRRAPKYAEVDLGANKIMKETVPSGGSPSGVSRATRKLELDEEEGSAKKRAKQSDQDQTFTPTDLGNDMITKAPYIYISSLPSKGARDELLDALNTWYQVPEASVATIRKVVEIMHNVSLMIDDIQDGSPLRRGSPSTHILFGVGQTLNAATNMYARGVQIATNLSHDTLKVLFEELNELHIGQALDLWHTYHCRPPSLPAYFKLIEQKTGGLFRMVSRMMQAEATKNTDINTNSLMNLFGRYYQVRDDYQDILGTSVGKSGTYNDLDQGSFTLPVIHALEHQEKNGNTELLSILQANKTTTVLSPGMKALAVKQIEKAGSLRFTKSTLDETYEEMQKELCLVEEKAGIKNWILRLLQNRLKV
ncbi:Ophiobolin F synthase [Lachnellula suecica]|uniref:Ophiobolin F synthase n=1 Tax=Lachnellula suecica TaxID=602035 RepID=A0A8T9C4H4_9HELO|nr:Ophiobolin F synthase [Lachnellula suecica]